MTAVYLQRDRDRDRDKKREKDDHTFIYNGHKTRRDSVVIDNQLRGGKTRACSHVNMLGSQYKFV